MYAAPATPSEIPSHAKTAAVAREGLAYLALEVCGYTGSAVAALLGVRPPAVYRAAQRGQATRGRWERQLTAGETGENIRKQPYDAVDERRGQGIDAARSGSALLACTIGSQTGLVVLLSEGG